MAAPLPDKPSLEQFDGNAELLRDFVRAGVDGPVDLVRQHHPRAADLTLPELDLADAQLTLARHHGFDDWAALRRHVELVNELTRSPHEQPVGGDLPDDDARADELIRLACLNYGADHARRWAAAAELLAAHPHLTGWSIHTAAATGDLAAATAILADDPDAAGRDGGPFRWAPLLSLTYSRLPPTPGADRTAEPLAVARLLLDHGADPNAGYLWDGLPSPFTALTGVFGRGEQGAPPHPDELALARLLLEAGAEANDSQTIYNRGAGDVARDDTGFLELLLEFGLGRGDGGPWRRRLGHEHQSPTEMVTEALQHASERDLPNRVQVLLAHGVDPNQPGCHPTYEGRRPYEGAVLHGNLAVAELLAAAGADTSLVDDRARLVGALLADDAPNAGAAAIDLDADPELLDQVRTAHPDLIAEAAELGRPAAIRRLAGLGFDVDHRERTTALHVAAWRDDRAVVDALLDLGADPTILDTEFDSPPAGWADHAGHTSLAAHLRTRAADR